MRGGAILFVPRLPFCAGLLKILPSSPFAFDHPPYPLARFSQSWTALGWFGFDLFCAWLNIYLMELFFFLSGLLQTACEWAMEWIVCLG